MSQQDINEQDLRMEAMATEIEYKRALVRWEPWKAMALAFGAGAAVATAMFTAVLAIVHSLT